MDTHKTFEKKTDMPHVRDWLASLCLSSLGRRMVDKMRMSSDCQQIACQLSCNREMRWLLQQEETITTAGYHDITIQVNQLRIDGSYLSTDELAQLRQILLSTQQTVYCVCKKKDDDSEEEAEWLTPTLAMMGKGVNTLPQLLQAIDYIMNTRGEIRDDASDELYHIRQNIQQERRNMSGRVQRILSLLQKEGVVDTEATAVIREGVLLLPIPAMNRNKVPGITHGESQGGGLVYIEPEEVVQANHRLRKLLSDEQTEIIRILKIISDEIRPQRDAVQICLKWLALIDFTRAKAILAEQMHAVEPVVADRPLIDWSDAYHPLLRKKREEQGEKCVPLNISIFDDVHMLVISGPNAGGKSVCLKTIGLLQCMLQCGLSVPMNASSRMGVFRNMMINIGDDQSIDDELSTYSSHLRQLKRMMQDGDKNSLLLIDELGGGTEPTAGGAIAEVVLERLLKLGCTTVVTTHFQNLKHFASTNKGVQNGAMLYDDVNMCPLYELVQGQAGSSFALDIARRVGFSQELINEVKTQLGEVYVKQERFLHDVYRDRRYWHNKRKSVAQLEKQLQERIEKYALKRQRLIDERDSILREARVKAEQLLSESNKIIESTIREIRETNADKLRTKEARKALEEKRLMLEQLTNDSAKHSRKGRNKHASELLSKSAAKGKKRHRTSGLHVGTLVKMKGMGGVGIIESIDDTTAVIVTGNLKMRIEREKLEKDFEVTHELPASSAKRSPGVFIDMSSMNTSTYSPSIDLRGERADDALVKVERFIDETVVRGMHEVRILHGKGDGILSSVIRKYLSDRKEVKSFRDEHVDFGGAGITIVEMG